MITWLLGSERGCEQSLVYLNCQCCRLGVARDAWRVCRMAHGIRFAMISIIILRLFRETAVASQATRVCTDTGSI